MYKVLLVDDEPLIRRGLLKIIDWNKLNCEVLFSVGTGLDALNILSNNHIDIVISDIKMPGMTGIDLAKYIYENLPYTKIILLTGYSDFTYAQSAIQYNVVDFILKPTNTEKIAEALTKAKLSIAKTVTNESKFKILEEKMFFNNQKLQCTVLNNIIKGIIDTSCINSKLATVDISLSNYYIVISKIKESPNCDNGIDEILNILPLIFSNVETYSSIISNSTLYTVINSANILSELELTNLCLEAITMLRNFKCCNILFGISSLHKNVTDLPLAYTEAYDALNFAFYDYEDENIFFINKYNINEIDPNTINKHVNNVINHLNNKEFNQLMDEITNMFIVFKQNRYSIEHIKHICILICSKCSDLLLNDNISFANLVENPNIFSDILTCTSITTLSNLIKNSIDITFYALNNKPNEKNSIVDNAKEYISKNYTNPNLTLNDIATHVHVSNAYLSRLFKEKTGETISELIIKTRINTAKDLLRNSQMKIYEIAYSIGIDDPAYFSQLFKKITGLSPKEYKYMH